MTDHETLTEAEEQRRFDEGVAALTAKFEKEGERFARIVLAIFYVIPAMIVTAILIYAGVVTSITSGFVWLFGIIAAFWLLDILLKVVLLGFRKVKDKPLTVGNAIMLGAVGFALAAYIW